MPPEILTIHYLYYSFRPFSQDEDTSDFSNQLFSAEDYRFPGDTTPPGILFDTSSQHVASDTLPSDVWTDVMDTHSQEDSEGITSASSALSSKQMVVEGLLDSKRYTNRIRPGFDEG